MLCRDFWDLVEVIRMVLLEIKTETDTSMFSILERETDRVTTETVMKIMSYQILKRYKVERR